MPKPTVALIALGLFLGVASGASAQTTLFRVTPDGKVGIGTDIPNDKLEVVGNIVISGCIKTTAGTVIGGNCTATPSPKLPKPFGLLGPADGAPVSQPRAAIQAPMQPMGLMTTQSTTSQPDPGTAQLQRDMNQLNYKVDQSTNRVDQLTMKLDQLINLETARQDAAAQKQAARTTRPAPTPAPAPALAKKPTTGPQSLFSFGQ